MWSSDLASANLKMAGQSLVRHGLRDIHGELRWSQKGWHDGQPVASSFRPNKSPSYLRVLQNSYLHDVAEHIASCLFLSDHTLPDKASVLRFPPLALTLTR